MHPINVTISLQHGAESGCLRRWIDGADNGHGGQSMLQLIDERGRRLHRPGRKAARKCDNEIREHAGSQGNCIVRMSMHDADGGT